MTALACRLLYEGTETESYLTPQRKWRGYPLVNLPVHPGANRKIRPPASPSSDERSSLVPVAMHDRVGAHIRERLNGERRIEPAHRREGRTADDEQIRNVPALAVAIHHRCFWIAAHPRAALMVRARRARTRGSPPHMRRVWSAYGRFSV